MSADNYIVVRKFQNGWRWAMGFASDSINRLPDKLFSEKIFANQYEAADDARGECLIIEYGIIVETDDGCQMYVIELTAGWFYSDGQYRRGENAHRLEFAERFETEKAAFRCLQGLRKRLAVEFREAKIVEVEDG